MDEEIERLVVGVRADTSAFARDVAEMRAQLEGPLAAGADRAGHALEHALLRAVRTGRVGFEDLKRVALSAMAEIAAAAVRGGVASLSGAQGLQASGLMAVAAQVLGAALGAPGRATGGPVAPGRAYLVGERGPELFVPTASGRVEAPRAGERDIRMSITINAPTGAEPQALAASSRQVARAVKQALMRVED
ncbi:tail tape measure protein [Sphingosinicella humi]|uniref:Tail tape measure protein n=1 Tax=Allosphingosinicella humi TaxID=2068657 RepID=A0A2U2J0I2_9SPHN|nr:tail tape measure protein [Sphingosinicella humi]PWG01832.1 tail tape measure protein [Sphingosinicella humi]